MDVVIALFRLFVAWLAVMGLEDLWRLGDLHTLVFFTNQSGLLLAVVMVWGAVAQVTRVRQPPAWLKCAVVLFLVITALVSMFVLEPESPDAPALVLGLTSGTIEHELNPALAVVDFLLLDAHRRLRWRNAAYWVLYLVGYAAFALVRAELLPEPDYPYGFIDLGELGWGGFLTNVAMYGVGFYVLGLLVVAVDRALPHHALIGSADSTPAAEMSPSAGAAATDAA